MQQELDHGDLDGRLRASAPLASHGLDRSVGIAMVLQAVQVIEPQPICLGRFEIRERLGTGGMGSVYRAFDPELERDVALKVLHRQPHRETTDLIIREAKALARLAHPNVVTVHELGTQSDQLFVVMEYVRGTNVRQRIQSASPPMSWTEVVHIFVQAGRGLHAAHEAAIVHRDFKPENVLVSDDGRVLVADFGLARDRESLSGKDERDEGLLGTPEFMAPELFAGAAADAHSDQYSFCASLWKMLDPGTPPGNSGASIAPPVLRVLQRGLSVDPRDRWPGMDAVIAALEAALRGTPEDRQRSILLDRVERLWIGGVLGKALEGREPLPISVSDASDRIDRPWSTLVPSSEHETANVCHLVPLLEVGNGSLLVLGEPGAGKTIALLLLADALAKRARADPFEPAPVVLNLSSFARFRGSLRRWIESELVTKYSLPRPRVQQWLDKHVLVLLLDGLDEALPQRRGEVVRAINAFRSEHPVPIVVACRTDAYDRAGAKLTFGAAVRVDPLAETSIREMFVARGITGDSIAPLVVEPDDGDRLRTPLMAALASRVGGAIPQGDRQLEVLYEQYVEHALTHRSGTFPSPSGIVDGLRWLAKAMSRVGTTELWIEQIDARWFPTRWQSLSACMLGAALLAIACVLGNLAVAVIAGRELASGLILGLCLFPIVVVLNRGLQIKPVGALRWSWRRALRGTPLTIALGLALGAVYGSFYVLWVNVIYGAVGGLVCAVSIGLEPAEHESRVRPNQGILQSARNGLFIGLTAFVVGGVLIGFVVTPQLLPHLPPESMLHGLDRPLLSVGTSAGGLLGILIGMIHGGVAVLLHAAVRLVLALTTPLPLRLVPFLERAADLAFMRRVGGGYIFLHRTFQDFLATGLAHEERSKKPEEAAWQPLDR